MLPLFQKGHVALLLALQAVVFSGFSQNVITTIAGTGVMGFSGDSGQAINAELSHPVGICIDKTGNVLFADAGNNRIRKINATGLIFTIAGTGNPGFNGDTLKATFANLNSPYGVSTNPTGDIFIADYINHRIRRINAFDTIFTFAGTGSMGYNSDNIPPASAQLNYPADAFFDTKNQALYIADAGNNRIRKCLSSGLITTIAGTGAAGYGGDNGPATSAVINYPANIVVNSKGQLLFTDLYNNRIRVIDTNGIIRTVAGTGVPGFSGDNGPAIAAQLYNPSGITIDSIGNIFFCDQQNHRVRKIDTNQLITTIAGTGIPGYNGDNIPALSAQLNYPNGVILDSIGNLLVSDNANHRIRKITNVGVMSSRMLDEEATLVKCFPNPNAGRFTILLPPNSAKGKLHILNSFGTLVMQKEINEKSSLVVEGFQEGVYWVSVLYENGSAKTERVVIIR